MPKMYPTVLFCTTGCNIYSRLAKKICVKYSIVHV